MVVLVQCHGTFRMQIVPLRPFAEAKDRYRKRKVQIAIAAHWLCSHPVIVTAEAPGVPLEWIKPVSLSHFNRNLVP